jgi:Flp pilus assembly pilin Flp
MIVSGIKAFWHDLRGAALVEYALLLSLIPLICVVLVSFFGEQIFGMFIDFALALKGVQTARGW